MNTYAFIAAVLIGTTAIAQETRSRVLFDFSDPRAAMQWRTVNDGVMGGRSDGRFMISNANEMEFFGTLSLENNGGFASVRSQPKDLGLRAGDILVARVKGDGRRYTLNLYVPARRTAFSYRVAFNTRKDQWIDVRVPITKFVATSYGQIVRNAAPVDAQQVTSIGVLLGDKKPGAFKLVIAWIKTEAS